MAKVDHLKIDIRLKYCKCVFHYVCYAGMICMNRDCGKPHQFVRNYPRYEKYTIFAHPENYMIINAQTKDPAWAKKNGSIEEEINGPPKRFNAEESKHWWKFWK